MAFQEVRSELPNINPATTAAEMRMKFCDVNIGAITVERLLREQTKHLNTVISPTIVSKQRSSQSTG